VNSLIESNKQTNKPISKVNHSLDARLYLLDGRLIAQIIET
jgi:hypothetical protein